ncbi:hypothetical protein CPLU01_02773 [Colletotrichum plurivorum]|uniref:Uncharacterized protein n=1 Tax=Colletotrichum plurivorum TaxID=2175906 RepID=A0A8H6NLC2_9PEZI|nr:hypothetical protein CPLU01_02773 [Colletotrichum plurivorum]
MDHDLHPQPPQAFTPLRLRHADICSRKARQGRIPAAQPGLPPVLPPFSPPIKVQKILLRRAHPRLPPGRRGWYTVRYTHMSAKDVPSIVEDSGGGAWLLWAANRKMR